MADPAERRRCAHADLHDLGYVRGSKGRSVHVLQCRECGAYVERVEHFRPLTDYQTRRSLV